MNLVEEQATHAEWLKGSATRLAALIREDLDHFDRDKRIEELVSEFRDRADGIDMATVDRLTKEAIAAEKKIMGKKVARKKASKEPK